MRSRDDHDIDLRGVEKAAELLHPRPSDGSQLALVGGTSLSNGNPPMRRNSRKHQGH
jgi:hypothetical protein